MEYIYSVALVTAQWNHSMRIHSSHSSFYRRATRHADASARFGLWDTWGKSHILACWANISKPFVTRRFLKSFHSRVRSVSKAALKPVIYAPSPYSVCFFSGHWTAASSWATQVMSNVFVLSFTHLKDKPHGDRALHMLKKIASLVKPIMRNHGWKLPLLAEFFPEQHNLLGKRFISVFPRKVSTEAISFLFRIKYAYNP